MKITGIRVMKDLPLYNAMIVNSESSHKNQFKRQNQRFKTSNHKFASLQNTRNPYYNNNSFQNHSPRHSNPSFSHSNDNKRPTKNFNSFKVTQGNIRNTYRGNYTNDYTSSRNFLYQRKLPNRII